MPKLHQYYIRRKDSYYKYENITRRTNEQEKLNHPPSIYSYRRPKVNRVGHSVQRANTTIRYNGAIGKGTKSPHHRPVRIRL